MVEAFTLLAIMGQGVTDVIIRYVIGWSLATIDSAV